MAYNDGMETLTTQQVTLLTILVIWELVWKAFALWRAARLNDKLWFALLVIFNTAGILPIVYLFIISKKKSTAKEQ